MIQPTVNAMQGPGSPYGGMPGHQGFGPPGGGMPAGPPPGGQPPPGGGGFPGAPPPAVGPRTDALGVVSLITGIISIVIALVNVFFMVFGSCCAVCTIGATFIGIFALIPGVVGVGSGGFSLKRIKEQPAELGGKGIALAGTICSSIGVLLALVTIILPWLGMGCIAAGSAAGRHAPHGGPAPQIEPWQPSQPVAPSPQPLNPTPQPLNPNQPLNPTPQPVQPQPFPLPPGIIR